jgi:hypothetical protein
MPVPCYGCGESVRVDGRWPEQGLLLAGWTLADGETYCPGCALARGFSDPRGFDPTPNASVVTQADEASVVPAGIAIADAATSEAVRRYLRGALVSTFVGLFGVVAVILVITLRVAHERALYASGTHTNGVIVRLESCCGGPASVRYVAGGQTLYGRESLPPDAQEYFPGESIDVSYDPQHPSRLRSPTAGVPPAWGRPLSLAGVFGAALLIGGLVAGRRAGRWRVLLAGSTWNAYRLTYVRMPRRAPGLLLTPAEGDGAPLKLHLGPVFKWRSAMLRTAGGRTVWLAGAPTSKAVLAVHPGPSLFPTRPVRARERRGYEKALASVEAMRALSPPERRAAVAKAHQRSELRLVIGWGCLGLLTISHPSTLAWIVLAAESVVWGLAVVRLKLARERALEEPDDAGEPELTPGRA